MKAAISLTALLFLLAGITVQAQRRTVTNADLDKFRQKREAAEKDYRENYEKMGFPSPEELRRQIEQSHAAQLELAARLAAERIERERIQIERERIAVERENLALEREAMEAAAAPGPYFDGFYNGGYFFGGRPFFGNRGFRSGRTYTNVGNGIPLVNYFGTPRRAGPPVNMGRR